MYSSNASFHDSMRAESSHISSCVKFLPPVAMADALETDSALNCPDKEELSLRW